MPYGNPAASDFIANCSGVTPGGKDALDCLKRNLTNSAALARQR